MRNSDVAYIKAMLWGIVAIQYSELTDIVFWIAILNILFYGIEFVFYKYKENGEG